MNEFVMSDNSLTNEKINALWTIRDLLFYFCLGVYLIQNNLVAVSLWRRTYIWFNEIATVIDNLYMNRIEFILIGCIFITFFTTKPNILRIGVFLSLVLIGWKVSIVQGDVYYYLGMLLIVAAYKINAKRILVYFVSVNFSLLFITILSSKIGYLENFIELGRNREYLGYTWTTTPVMIFSYSVFAYLILKRGRINIAEFVLICGTDYWFFLKTNTKFSFLIILLVVLFFTYMGLIRTVRVPVIERNILAVAPWLSFLLVYCVSVAFDPKYDLMLKFNRLLSNRLRQCEYALRVFPVLPFGQPISWVSTMYATTDNPANYVDTAYLQTLLKYGGVSLIALLILCSYIVYRSYKEKKFYIAWVLGFIAIFGLFEQQMLYFQFDVLLLLAFSDWRSLKSDVTKPTDNYSDELLLCKN